VLDANVSAALRTLVSKNAVRVRIHPSQRESLEATLPQLRLTWPQLQQVELMPDDAVEPGGCRVSSAGGEIDATIDGQIERLIEQLYPRAQQQLVEASPVEQPKSIYESISPEEHLD
jgi:flagellar assembly protein FliH